MIDYEKINENIIPEKVLNLMIKLGVSEYDDRNNDFYIFPTICHNRTESEASMKLYFYKDTKIFHCYTEDGSMTLFTFLKKYYETNGINYKWYKDIYLKVLACTSLKSKIEINKEKSKYKRVKRVKRKTLPTNKIYDEKILKVFIEHPCIEWLNDGVTVEAMNKYNILYAPTDNKIIIPHYDYKNQLIGIRARSLNEWDIINGKYKPICINEKIYSHKLSLNLYGLNKNLQNIRETGIVFLFEGEKSVLQMENFSIPNCGLAVCGSKMNKFQLILLLSLIQPDEIVICFDKEEIDGENKYFNKLYNMVKKYNNYSKFSFMYDINNLLKYKDSPTDRGEKIFMELFNTRVEV